MSRRPARTLDRDAGFTLVELLITIVVIGTITLPLGNLVIEYFQNTVTTQNRAAVSHDEQIAATYFSNDVASVGLRSSGTLTTSVWYSSTAGAPFTCGTGITPFLVLAWDEYSSAGTRTTSEAVYGTRSQSDLGRTELQLVRMHCSASSGTPDTSAVLAHNLVATPTVSCDGTSTAAACANASPVPSVVALTMSLRDPQDTGTTYPVVLTGTRRQS